MVAVFFDSMVFYDSYFNFYESKFNLDLNIKNTFVTINRSMKIIKKSKSQRCFNLCFDYNHAEFQLH